MARRWQPTAEAGAAEPTALVICTDVLAGARERLGLFSQMSRRPPYPRVLVAESLCERPETLTSALRALPRARVVVVCGNERAARVRIVAALRSEGVHPQGCHSVEAAFPAGLLTAAAAAEVAARVNAALAWVAAADLGVPLGVVAEVSSAPVSRRHAFAGSISRRPVPTWNNGRCTEPAGCRRCMSVCPGGALTVAEGRVVVDLGQCSSCGVCAVVCPASALAVPGMPPLGVAAAAMSLATSARLLRADVVLACAAASSVPLGEGLLPLEVPSLDVVSLGWMLQLVAGGVGVSVRGCDDPTCASRADELSRLCALVLERYGEPVRARSGGPRGAVGGFETAEPTASLLALSLLESGSGRDGEPAPSPGGWRIASPVAPFGDLAIDTALCSGCGHCASLCPSGSIAADTVGRDLRLSFDPSTCLACGACATACPETALSFERVVDPSFVSDPRKTVAVLPAPPRCRSCGRPLAGGLSADRLALRLRESHPCLAGLLVEGGQCFDCRLVPLRPGVHGDARGESDSFPGPHSKL